MPLSKSRGHFSPLSPLPHPPNRKNLKCIRGEFQHRILFSKVLYSGCPFNVPTDRVQEVFTQTKRGRRDFRVLERETPAIIEKYFLSYVFLYASCASGCNYSHLHIPKAGDNFSKLEKNGGEKYL